MEQKVTVIWCSVCLSVYEQNFWTTNNIGTSIEPPKYVKLYKDQNKRQAFSKLLGYKVTVWQFLQLTIAISPLSEDI